MANPAPTINQINAFNATQGTIIDFNIIGGTELVRSNKIYIYDLSDNSLICTHLYVSTESIHELPANTDGSIVYESGKSSADFVNGKQYYAQIQTFTDIAGTQGGSGLSVSKLFWCLVDPSLTIDTIPSSISTTSYNVSATYNANTSVVSNIIQQYQFNLYSATGSLLQSSGVIVGNGEQQGTSTAYDISYNFTGLSVGSSYYVAVDVTTTQGMSVNAQSGTFTVSIDTPTLGEATVVNNACDGYISVTSNLSSEYGGSASGEIATFETDSVNRVTKLEVELDPIQLGEGTPSPSNVRPIVGHSEVEAKIEGKNLLPKPTSSYTVLNGITMNVSDDGTLTLTGTATNTTYVRGKLVKPLPIGNYTFAMFNPVADGNVKVSLRPENYESGSAGGWHTLNAVNDHMSFTTALVAYYWQIQIDTGVSLNNFKVSPMLVTGSTAPTDYVPYVDPVEVEQDFNVTLTPTVIDETPYLFKQTGDVRGDRESLELVGGTVNWNQLLYSKFEQNWAAPLGTMSVQDGIATVTADGSGNCYMRTQTSMHPANHVYLMSCDVKLDSNNTTDYPTTTFLLSWTSGGYVNKSNPAKGTWGNVATLLKPNVEWSVVGIYCMGTGQQTSGEKAQAKTPLCVDLTAFFGNSATADYVYSLEQANAGAGIAWLRKYFPDLFAYNAYDTGTLKSVKPTAHVTRGVNQWDEEWEVGGMYNSSGLPNDSATVYFRSKNFIPILPSATYYFKTSGDSLWRYYYDADKNYISYSGGIVDNTDTVPTNAHYMKVVNVSRNSYDKETRPICINISNSAINGKYFQYEEHTYPLGDVVLRGIPKLANNELVYDGDIYEHDGSVQRRFRALDLSTLTWSTRYTGSTNKTLSASVGGSANYFIVRNGWMNCIYEKHAYIERVTGAGGLSDPDNKTVGLYNYTNSFSWNGATDTLYLVIPTGETPSGILVYELATPTTETADPFTDPQEVSIYGTEEFVSSNGVSVGNKTTYKTRDIFGGKIDLVSGVLTVDKVGVNIGDLNFARSTTWGNMPIFQVEISNIKSPSAGEIADIYCERYNPVSANTLYIGSNNSCSVNAGYFRVTDTTYSDVASFKSAVDGTMLVYPLETPLTYQLTPHEIETLIGTNNVWSNAGDVLIEFNIPITDLLVKRQDVDDVSGNWLTLYSQPVEQASDMDFTFIDYLNQYGKTYKYALVPLLTQTQSGVEVEVEGGYTVSDEVQSIFDGVYIGDSTGVQRLKAGVAYNNLNTNQQVGVIPTLGNKYPIIVSNGNIQYDTGSVSGLIVPDDFYSNGNLSRLDMSDKRGVINDFLTNKKPKILKDWNGNIWLVVFTDNVDVSFDNNYGMGVATFTSGWTEVGDPTNQEDLQRTGLINVGGD